MRYCKSLALLHVMAIDFDSNNSINFSYFTRNRARHGGLHNLYSKVSSDCTYRYRQLILMSSYDAPLFLGK